MSDRTNTKLCEFLYLATTRCNCRCKHCSPSLYTGKENEMSSKKLIERYEESYFLQNNSVSVAGGEPFVKEDIDEFIVYLDKKKIPCIISTNGYFTEKIERLIDKLEDARTVKFSISIDGIGGIHDEIRGIKGIYDRAISSAKLLQNKGFAVQINMVAQKMNINAIPEMKKLFEDLSIPLNIIPKFKVNNEEFEFDEEQIRKVYPDIYLPREKKLLLSKGEYTITQNCHAGKNSWLLDSNGDVYACCGAYYGDEKEKFLLGNICDTPFDDVFTSEQAIAVYENSVKKCSGCANARDVEREVTEFGYSTEYTIDDISIFKDCITNECVMDEVNCDNFNWNDLEKDAIGNYRWTKKLTANVFLKVPHNYSRMVIHLFNLRDYKENGEKGVFSCKIGDKEIGWAECKLGEQAEEFSLEEIDLTPGEVIKITFCTNMQWVPRLVGMGNDDRCLGVAIRSIAIYE